MSKRVVIVGGVAAGMKTAARLRRLDAEAEIIVLERGPQLHPCFTHHPTPGCPHCTHCSGGDAVNMEDFEEFQDYDEF